jgi:hypothetical protein
VDANVSNVAVVSFPNPHRPPHKPATSVDSGADGGVVSSQLVLTRADQERHTARQLRERRRRKALERSRRASNAAQYQLSRRQRRRAERRRAAGLAPKQVPVPGGPRLARADGKPLRAPRRDALSRSYRRLRGRQAAAAHRATRSRRRRARDLAGQIVAVHGPHLTIEDCIIGHWFRLWGRACARFTPGTLTAALERECAAAGGRLLRASTRATALSQHCLCGRRAPKPLSARTHHCPAGEGGCGLRGDRDLVAAALAAFIVFEDPDDPSTARVDHDASRRALRGRAGAAWSPVRVNRTPPHPHHRHSRRSRRHARWRDGRRGSHPPPPHPPAQALAECTRAGGLCSAYPDQYGADPG